MKCHVVKHAVVQVGLDDVDRSYEDRATPEEAAVIEASTRAWLAGKNKPLSTFDIGHKSSTTMKAAVQTVTYPDKANPKRRTYVMKERDLEEKDILLAKLVTKNQFGGDDELDSGEPFTPRVRICLYDGSQAEVPLVEVKKEKKPAA